MFDPKPFKVLSEPCNQCLLSKNAVVSNKRRKEHIEDTIKAQTHFVCHKVTGETCCRGFYDAYKYKVLKLAFTEAHDLVDFVKLEDCELLKGLRSSNQANSPINKLIT